MFPTLDANLEVELGKSIHGKRVNEIVAQIYEIVIRLSLSLPDELNVTQRALRGRLSREGGGALIVIATPYKLHLRRDALF